MAVEPARVFSLELLPFLLLRAKVHQQTDDGGTNLAHAGGHLRREVRFRGLDQRHQPEDAHLLVVLTSVVPALVPTPRSIVQHREPRLQRRAQRAVFD